MAFGTGPRISLQGLAAGTHTIETTHRDERTTGGFTLTVTASASEPGWVKGLDTSHDITVGELFSTGWTYGPPGTSLSMEPVQPTPGLDPTLRDRGLNARGISSAGVAGKVTHAGTYTVTLTLTQPGRVDRTAFTVEATCPRLYTKRAADRVCEPPEITTNLKDKFDDPLTATVGETLTTTFVFSPAAARVSQPSVSQTGLSVTAEPSQGADFGGLLTLTATPTHAGTYEITINFTQRLLTQTRTDPFKFKITATCPEGKDQVGSLCKEPLGAIRTTNLAASYSLIVAKTRLIYFTHLPITALPSLASASSDGLGVQFEYSENTPGRVALKLTPLRPDSWTIMVKFTESDGRVYADRIVVNIVSSCPTNTAKLDRSCVVPKERLDYKSDAWVVPQPTGSTANSCYRMQLPDDKNLYTCRKIDRQRTFVRKADHVKGNDDPLSRIVDLGDEFGHIIVLGSDDALEGCQSYNSLYWQCDYRAENIWNRRAWKRSDVFSALDNGVRKPLWCAAAITRLAVTREPIAMAAVVTLCEQSFWWED